MSQFQLCQRKRVYTLQKSLWRERRRNLFKGKHNTEHNMRHGKVCKMKLEHPDHTALPNAEDSAKRGAVLS